MKWQIIGLLVLVVLWVLVSWPSQELRVVFCDVGQGDAQLITKGRTQILIDGGPGVSVMECLAKNIPFWDRKIEIVVNTHADKDHIGGLDEVIGSYEIELLIVGQPGSNQDYERVVSEVKKRGIKVYIPEVGDRLRIGEMEFEVLWPGELQPELASVWEGKMDSKVLGLATTDLNKESIVMRLEYGEFTAMFTGDIGEVEEQALISSGVITPVTVLKVAHHGSKYSSAQAFVEAVRPQLAVIGVGKKNSYGHPSSIIMDRFDTVGSRILRTDIHGQTVVMTDGQKWSVRYENGE